LQTSRDLGRIGRRIGRALALTLPLCVAACESGAPEESPPERPPLADAAGSWTVESEARLSIGVQSGDERYQFSEIAAAARQSDGDIVVADARSVRLYGRDGVLRRTLGSGGSGPGEFQNPGQIVIGSGDSILVWDDALFRSTVFDPEGGLVAVRAARRDPLGPPETPLYPATGLLLTTGELVVRLTAKGGKGAPSAAAPGTPREWTRVMRTSADGTEGTLLMELEEVERVTVDSPWGPIQVQPPLAKGPLIAVQPNRVRLCMGDRSAPEVHCFDEEGVERVIRWDAPSMPVREDDPDVAAWRARTIESYSGKLRRTEAEDFVSGIPLPTERPPYSSLHLDTEGNLWVELQPVTDEDGEALEHLVFDPSGHPLGTVRVPSIRILEIGTDYILGVQEDELEVQHLRLLQIDKRKGDTP
jgi:hypothetical protein